MRPSADRYSATSKIFEIQTAAIRYELGDNHIYDFVEGTIPSKMQPGTVAGEQTPRGGVG